MRLVLFAVACSALFGKGVCARAAENSCGECAGCHRHIFDSCKSSPKGRHHFYANGDLSDGSAGKFAPPAPVVCSSSSFAFKNAGSNLNVEISENGKSGVFPVKMAIGQTPLRQPVVDCGSGRFQVLPAAIDSESGELFDVFGGEKRLKGDWGHWSGGGMTWNSNCAYCHMTGFKKNFDISDGLYRSSWIEHGVRCVQCHSDRPAECAGGNKNYRRPSREDAMYACAQCHSRREQLSADKFRVGENYFDHFRPVLADDKTAYYQDGKVKSESFMFGSFMMCRQYAAGITCADCHDPHTLKTAAPIENNKLCMVCHDVSAKNRSGAPTINVKKHTFHDSRGGDQCMDCHMPTKFFMQRDRRYDHGLTSPDPRLTLELGIPNACSECHEKIDAGKPERNFEWLLENFEKRHLTKRLLHKRKRAMALYKSQEGQLSEGHKNDLLDLLESEDNPAWKSIILKQLSAYADDADIPKILEREYAGGHPLVRAACVHLAEFLPHADRIKRAFASDASRLVRIDAGLRFKTEKRNTEELMEYLDFNADSPIGALKRSEYMLSEGRADDAVKSAVAAVRMEPGNSEIKLQSAILLFRAGDFPRSESLFKSVCDGDPSNAHAHYLYGLFLGEMGRLAESADLFEKSVRADANFIRGWYNLSVAYLKLGMADKASETADILLKKEPWNQEFIELKRAIKASVENSKEHR